MNTARATATAVAAAGLLTTAAGVATASVSRPVTEHVPTTIHMATVLQESGTGAASAHLVRGTAARHLITLFDALKLEPKDTVHCDIAGGPMTIVSFRGLHHTWKATQGACTNVQVTRDGKPLPTLLPSQAWANAVQKQLS